MKQEVKKPKYKRIRLNTSDLHKLKKYSTLRVGKYLISVDDIPVKQVKMYGEFNG